MEFAHLASSPHIPNSGEQLELREATTIEAQRHEIKGKRSLSVREWLVRIDIPPPLQRESNLNMSREDNRRVSRCRLPWREGPLPWTKKRTVELGGGHYRLPNEANCWTWKLKPKLLKGKVKKKRHALMMQICFFFFLNILNSAGFFTNLIWFTNSTDNHWFRWSGPHWQYNYINLRKLNPVND